MALRQRASGVIGAMVLAWLVMRRFRLQLKATRQIQRAWRRSRLRLWLARRRCASRRISAQLRAFSGRRRHQRIRSAGALLVTGAWMWRQSRLHEQRTCSATRIASWWRGSCVRENMERMRDGCIRLQRWWRATKIAECVADAVLKFFIKRKILNDQRLHRHASVIQRGARRWALRDDFSRKRETCVKIQALFRARTERRDVQLIRSVEGVRTKRYPSQLAALVPDKWGRLTRYRPFRAREKVALMRVRLVRLQVLSDALRFELEDAVAPLQAFVKHWLLHKQVLRVQCAWRGLVVRRRLQRQHATARRVQAWWRSSVSIRQADSLRSQVKVIQAHTRRVLVNRELAKHSKDKELDQNPGAETVVERE